MTNMYQIPAYPDINDENFMTKIFVKQEFHIHGEPKREELKTFEEIEKYRTLKCNKTGTRKPTNQQSLLPNYINPNTPYHGIIIFYGVGSGKTSVSIQIAETFKPLVEKYGTKIYVLVPGPMLKNNFKTELIEATGDTYTKYFKDNSSILDAESEKKIKTNALIFASKYYYIKTHRGFEKKVLGDRVVDHIENGKKVYRKDEDGNYIRDTPVDPIDRLDNTLIIIDEGHGLTNNQYGKALQKIINNSHNLKVIILSATPMKNLGDDIVPLLNFLRPQDNQIERDRIFAGSKNASMQLKHPETESINYLKKMARGYVSYLLAGDPLLYAEKVENGVIPPGLKFTKITRCMMEPFQLNYYIQRKINFEEKSDKLDKSSEAIANFVFPGLSQNKKELIGYHGIEGLNTVKYQIKSNSKLLNSLISELIKVKKDDWITMSDDQRNISGEIFRIPYLKNFSTKFNQAIIEIDRMVINQDGPGIGFIYSNLVRIGIRLFQTIMIINGYLEYQPDGKYVLSDNTKCYLCGITYSKHKNIKHHEFRPATFYVVTGQSEDSVEAIPEENINVIDNIFNTVNNKEGMYIKFILGSKVMNEGINLSNISRIFILDVHYTLGRLEQVIGRGIRYCRHFNVSTEENPFPKVYINKYVISLENEISSEEVLYKKAELKHILVKKIERALKEVSFDCPLNYNANQIPSLLNKYKGCEETGTCPSICDYMKCEYKCDDPMINEFFDEKTQSYRRLSKNELDRSTFTMELARVDINFAKTKIKELYIKNHVYKINDILEYCKSEYDPHKRDLFDDYFVYKALDELIPLSENDFNNFKDPIFDKYNRPGYLIYRKDYYIFQPFGENEDVPSYYRYTNTNATNHKINVHDYVRYLLEKPNLIKEQIDQNADLVKLDTYDTITDLESTDETTNSLYDFDSVKDYYDERDEFDIVGIIDKIIDKKNLAKSAEVFKIRGRRPKILKKKRDVGIPSYKGAVCNIKDLKDLQKIYHKMGIKTTMPKSKIAICAIIQDYMLHLEKYARTKNNNKMTYCIIPSNHPIFPFLII
jgi:superfamily II DNA or RNA helicase